MITCNAISAIKANRLYWLGRYTERVYISLHLLRRYYDKMIDGKPKEYEEYYQKLDTSNPYPDKESFRIGYMYDDKNPCSLISGLTAANDNAIVLREEIMSETLSYIELSLSYIRKSAEKRMTTSPIFSPLPTTCLPSGARLTNGCSMNGCAISCGLASSWRTWTCTSGSTILSIALKRHTSP